MLIAFDRASVRSYDADGRLRVEMTNISKAAINPYFGREIPNCQYLGLNPDRPYRLLRDPEELAKAASTFNNLPLLSRHVPVTADNHHPDLVMGSTGTDAVFESPYLRNSLVVWAREAIDGVEDETQKELSSAYRYRADMTPGTYEGEPYDGVMRDIIGNHVALVTKGRAGPDIVVGDSAPNHVEAFAFDFSPFHSTKDCPMAKSLSRKAILAQGALITFLAPKLAQDAAIDLTSALTGVTAKNFTDKKASIASAVDAALKGKLAQDASIDGLSQLLDSIDKIAIAADEDPENLPEPKTAEDEDDEDDKDKDGKKVPKTAEDEDEDDKDMVNKPAMDAAISTAVAEAVAATNKNQREIRTAERDVRPYVGELAMAHDSAEGVYRTALKALNVDVAGVHPSALSTILKMQPVPGAKSVAKTPIAMDAASASDYAKLFPQAGRIRQA